MEQPGAIFLSSDPITPLQAFESHFVPYLQAACGTVITYEYLITLEDEIALVWSHGFRLAPRTWINYLFLLNRYLPFADTFLSLYLLRTNNLSAETCTQGNVAVLWLILIGVLVSESVLLARTYALWGCTRRIGIALGIQITLVFIPCIVLAQIEAASLKYEFNCTSMEGSTIVFIAYILALISETIIVALTVIKAIQNQRLRPSATWLQRIYKDGLLFYVVGLLVTIATILLPVLGPSLYVNALASTHRVIHSICSTRVILRLRQSWRGENGDQADAPLTSIAFGSAVTRHTASRNINESRQVFETSREEV